MNAQTVEELRERVDDLEDQLAEVREELEVAECAAASPFFDTFEEPYRRLAEALADHRRGIRTLDEVYQVLDRG